MDPSWFWTAAIQLPVLPHAHLMILQLSPTDEVLPRCLEAAPVPGNTLLLCPAVFSATGCRHKLDIQLSPELPQKTTFTSLCLGFCADIREKQCHCYLAAPPHSLVGLTHSWYLKPHAFQGGLPHPQGVFIEICSCFCIFHLFLICLNSLCIFHRNFSPS